MSICSTCRKALRLRQFNLQRPQNPLPHLVDFPHAVYFGDEVSGAVVIEHRGGLVFVDCETGADHIFFVVDAASVQQASYKLVASDART